MQSKTEISIPLMREDVVVSKKPCVKEEIVIKKKSVTENKTVTDQVPSEKSRLKQTVEGKKYKILTEENSNFFYNSREMMFRFCNFKNAYTLW
jgi:uncharacterized protein (TIGR02271 family)